jgi:hypothetical protein
VRTMFRSGLVMVLSTALIAIATPASPAKPASIPLGVVLQADTTATSTDLKSVGATVYDGETLETETGSLRVRLGGPQMFLRSNTMSQVHGVANGFSASLMRGTVVASSAAGETFQILANGAIIRPVGSQPTVAQVSMLSSTAAVITSTRGALEVSMGDEVKTIEEGRSYRMEVEAEEAASSPQRGPYHTARNRFILIAIIAVAVGTGIGIWRVLESPDHP